MPPLTIVIIGGSIAGCAAAIPLLRAGHRVNVYERSRQVLSDRGAGIVIPKALFMQLQQLDMFDVDMPSVDLLAMDYRVHDDANPQGRELWQRPLEGSALRWGNLYEQLRKRIPDQYYHQGIEVVDINDEGSQTMVSLSNGEQQCVDLVIAAEGIYSLARKQLNPTAKPQYAGYVLWRGLVDNEDEVSESLSGRVLWHPYQGGLAGCYCIAAEGYTESAPKKTVNWGVYDKLDDDLLASLLPDLEVEKPGAYQLNDTARDYLYQLVDEKLAANTAQLIKKTVAPFVQPIVDVAASQLLEGRVVLIGDAAAVLRPHTASGAVKAIQNALSLAEAISEQKPLDDALQQWQVEQAIGLQQQIKLSNALGRGWVTEAPDWAFMNEQDMDAWWDAMVSGSDWYLNTAK